MNPLEIENLMDQEIETHHHEAMVPALRDPDHGRRPASLRHRGGRAWRDQTMASVGRPPAELGAMIASALVGTFLGILLAYGFVSPLAKLLESKSKRSQKNCNA